jgi:hypothetical protein
MGGADQADHDQDQLVVCEGNVLQGKTPRRLCGETAT